MATETFGERDGSDPFVEVRKRRGGYDVIEFVPGDVPDSERDAVIIKMLEEAHSAIGDTLKHCRTRVPVRAQRPEYKGSLVAPGSCVYCKKKRHEHEFFCPACNRTVPDSRCAAHTPVHVGLAGYCPTVTEPAQ